jgi:16S rRNA (uracil1498-N3)-methyltransferase
MNIFYAPPAQITADMIELRAQEATHATQVLRYKRGDDITIVDGAGGWYEGKVSSVDSDMVRVAVEKSQKNTQPQPAPPLALGIIKKRDRLEFAIKKAVELGVKEIVVFRGAHSVKQNVRADRLSAVILSAMKQSLQCWLPELSIYNSLPQLLEDHSESNIWVAHQDAKSADFGVTPSKEEPLLIVGPEGGLSEEELQLIGNHDGAYISLGENRLRTETATVAMVHQFNLGELSNRS